MLKDRTCCRLWGSNPGPLDFESNALPLSHHAPWPELYMSCLSPGLTHDDSDDLGIGSSVTSSIAQGKLDFNLKAFSLHEPGITSTHNKPSVDKFIKRYMSHIMRNRIFAYAKSKAQISFAVTAKLFRAFVFAAGIVLFLFFLNPKFQASSFCGCADQFVLDLVGKPEDRFLALRFKWYCS